MRAHPHGQPLPVVSNLNFTKGETISNLVVVPVVDGRVSFVNHSGSTQVIADLNGYYAG
ncbi:N-acetylmuramoyl-L-alanine amidase [Streptomyces fradiae]